MSRLLTSAAHAASIVLIGFLSPGLIQAIRSPHLAPPAVQQPRDQSNKTTSSGTHVHTRKPDIYFIVLDAYGRSDVPLFLFGFDNQAWLERMEKKGFYVAQQSHANYCQTVLSVTATLDGDYHEDMHGLHIKSRLRLRDSLRTSRIPRLLRSSGYKLVCFASGFSTTDDFALDHRDAPRLDLSEFSGLLLDMTPLWTTLGAGSGVASHHRHRERILHLFDHLAEVAADPSPTFCLARIVSPHPPFEFDQHGGDLSGENDTYRLTDGMPWSRIEGHGHPTDDDEHYRNQAAYISERVEATVDQILARSTEPPIILILGDHGPGSHFDPDQAVPHDLFERMSILDLVRLPQSVQAQLYPNTQVNTMRIVCDCVFSPQMGRLPDRCHYSSYQFLYEVTDVTKTLSNDPTSPQPGDGSIFDH